jgi:flagellar hook-length control protein FliK
MAPSGTDAKVLKLTDAAQTKESGVNPFLTGIDSQNTPPLWFNAVANPPNGLALDPKGTADGLMGIAASAQTSPSSWVGMPNASTQAAATNPLSTGMDLSASGFELDPTQLALSQVLSQHGAQLKVGSMGAPDTSHSPIDALAADATQTDSINLNAMRMSLIPAWENVTRQLANASGLQAQKWANLINGWSPSSKNGVAESFIDLGNTSAGDPIDTGDGMGKVSATFNNDNNIQLPNGTHQAPSLNLNGQVSTQDNAATSSTDSATQIAQMTDKLSQALSERLQTQIEQGQWKLELKLKPANLGKISVELDMNSGGLDAVFKTDNLMTRDLLVQSTQKLRDNLEQAGMTVANVWVNQNNQQGTGGNSTPWQQAPQNTVVESSGPKTQPTQNMSNIAKSADGWDQLV